MGIIGTAINSSNHAHVQALLTAAVGAGLGWAKPAWFGSATQAATMAAIPAIAAVTTIETLKETESPLPVNLVAFAVLLLGSAKGASYMGFETTWKHSMLMGLPTIGAFILFAKGGPNKGLNMPYRIPPVLWAALGYGAGKLFPNWVTPVEGATAMGMVAMTDLTLAHLGNARTDDQKKDESPSIKRAVLGLALLAACNKWAYRFSPTWKPLMVAAGIFYGQEAMRAKLGYTK